MIFFLSTKAMVNDIIKAVQETVVYFSQLSNNENIKPNGTNHTGTSYLKLENTNLIGTQHLLMVVGPLTVLLCDGLLPPVKPIFSSKPRTKLWQMVEESCRPGKFIFFFKLIASYIDPRIAFWVDDFSLILLSNACNAIWQLILKGILSWLILSYFLDAYIKQYSFIEWNKLEFLFFILMI